MVVRDFLKNSEGWMFVSIVNKDYPVLYFEDKSMTALVANKFLAKCEVHPTSQLCSYSHNTPQTIWAFFIAINNIFVQ